MGGGQIQVVLWAETDLAANLSLHPAQSLDQSEAGKSTSSASLGQEAYYIPTGFLEERSANPNTGFAIWFLDFPSHAYVRSTH